MVAQDKANTLAKTYQDKRSDAILAAAAVFAEKSYHGASTSDIAARLGIKQSSLYYYFSSKDEALEEVCILAMQNNIQGVESAIAEQQGFENCLRAMIRFHLQGYRGCSEALKVHNEQRFHLPEERRERIKKDGQRYREILQDLFEEQVKAGALASATDCLFAAQSVIGLCNAWGARIARDEQIDLEDLSHKCAQLILQGVEYRPSSNY